MPGRVPPRRLSPRETDEGDRLLRPKGPPLANRTQPGGRGRAGARAPGPGGGPREAHQHPIGQSPRPSLRLWSLSRPNCPRPAHVAQRLGQPGQAGLRARLPGPEICRPSPLSSSIPPPLSPTNCLLTFFFFFLIDSQKNLGPQRSPPCPSPRRHHHPLGAAPTPPLKPAPPGAGGWVRLAWTRISAPPLLF